MHKFAVIHKPSGIVCYSSNREIRKFEPGFNYEIVLNSAEYKTVSPDLNFSDYAEIADAVNLSDMLVFTKGENDTLTISDDTRSVTVPKLLFEEVVLDVEESVFGDICEIVEDFGFNKGCTELLAHNAVKFWTAARFLELSPTTETTTTETTHTVEVVADSLEIYESCEFEGESAFSYKRDEYLLGDFIHTELEGWHGVMGLSYFSAYYVRYENDGSLTLGYAYW